MSGPFSAAMSGPFSAAMSGPFSAAMPGLFPAAMSGPFSAAIIDHLFVLPRVVIACPVGVLNIIILIFNYPPSIAIHETSHEQVRHHTTIVIGVEPSSSFASSTRT
jgi:hypothetical protein